MHTPGPGFIAHSASAVHLRHLFASHTGRETSKLQSELVLHSTQAPDGPQAGLVVSLTAQDVGEAFEQPTHALATQNGRPGPVHSESEPHSRQAPAAEQNGREAFSFAQESAGMVAQPVHELLGPQKGFVGSLQSLAATHPTQAPDGPHTEPGDLPGHRFAGPMEHPTHVFATQAGFVGSLQSFPTLHSTQAPSGSHRGLAAFASVQARSPPASPQRTHTFATQKGRSGSSAQSAFALHVAALSASGRESGAPASVAESAEPSSPCTGSA